MAQLDALAEDPNSVLSTHIRQHTTARNCPSIHPLWVYVPLWVCAHMCTHTCIIEMRETERPAFIFFLSVDEI